MELRRDFFRVVQLQELVLERHGITPAELSRLTDTNFIPSIDELLELAKVHGPVAGRIQRRQQVLDLLLGQVLSNMSHHRAELVAVEFPGAVVVVLVEDLERVRRPT